MKNRIILLILLLCFSLQFPISVFANDNPPEEILTPTATLNSIDFENFPQVSGILDVRDGNGAFMSMLNPSNVSVLENGTSVPVQVLERQDVGVQVVVAINLTQRFSVYFEEGVTIYEKVFEDLANWGNGLATDDYDLSFVTNEGINSRHRISPREWLRAVELYEPDFENSGTNLDVLFTAINVASEEAPRQGMGKVVFYYTSIIDAEYNDNLVNLVNQAVANGVIIYPVFVDSNAYLETDETLNLRQMAEQTGGEMIYFADATTMSDLNSVLAPYGEVYQFTYNSTLKSTGEHEIAAVVNAGEVSLTTNSLPVALQVEPPTPFFVDPPVTIERVIDTSNASEDGFVPIFEPIEIMVDFPDGRSRAIVRSALLVNGEVVAENFSAPFETFEWSLIGFNETGVQEISIEVEDELGLVGRSVESSVQVMIQSPVLRWQSILSEYGYLITIAIAVLVGSALLVILILSGVIGPDNRAERRRIRKARKQQNSSMYYEPEGIRRDSQPILNSAARRTPSSPLERRGLNEDPVTQPVGSVVQHARIEKKRKKIREQAPERVLNLPRAILKKLNDDDQTIPGGALLIFDEETKIGSDKTQVNCWINDPSIQAVHAIVRLQDGQFLIADQKTVSGTWVNYAPINNIEGCQLEDGDLVHLGKFGFRFMLNKQYKEE